MDIGKEHDGFCTHDIRVPEGRTGHMESCKEGKVREPRVHTVDRADDIFPPGPDCPGIIHLINTHGCRSFADNTGDLAMGKKVAFPPRTDTEFPHFYAGGFEDKKVPGQSLGIFHFGNDRPGKCGCIGRIHGLIRTDDIDKSFLDCCFANAFRNFFTGIFLHIHASLYV